MLEEVRARAEARARRRVAGALDKEGGDREEGMEEEGEPAGQATSGLRSQPDNQVHSAGSTLSKGNEGRE